MCRGSRWRERPQAVACPLCCSRKLRSSCGGRVGGELEGSPGRACRHLFALWAVFSVFIFLVTGFLTGSWAPPHLHSPPHLGKGARENTTEGTITSTGEHSRRHHYFQAPPRSLGRRGGLRLPNLTLSSDDAGMEKPWASCPS